MGAIAGWTHPKFAKRGTVEEAIVALVMRGDNMTQPKDTSSLLKQIGLNPAKRWQVYIGEFDHALRSRLHAFLLLTCTTLCLEAVSCWLLLRCLRLRCQIARTHQERPRHLQGKRPKLRQRQLASCKALPKLMIRPVRSSY